MLSCHLELAKAKGATSAGREHRERSTLLKTIVLLPDGFLTNSMFLPKGRNIMFEMTV